MALYAVVNLAPAALEIGDLAGASPWPSFRALMDRFSPYPTAGWVGPFDPPLRPLTAADTHFLVADAACTTTAIATDADCWSHTSGGAGGAGVPGSGNVARLDAGSGAGAFTFDANMNVASFNNTGFTGTYTVGSITLTVNGDMNLSAGGFTGTSTVVFAANGTLTTPNVAGVTYLYNVTVNAGVTLTFASHVALGNAATINGTLVSQGGDAQRIFMVKGDATQLPLVLGASGDVDSSGYFYYRYEPNSFDGAGGLPTNTFGVAATTYQHLGVSGGSPGFLFTVRLMGNISTPACGVYRDCAILLSSLSTTPREGGYLTVDTRNNNITAGGILWLGDGGETGVTFNAGSSTIEAYGVVPLGNGVIANFDSSTVTAHAEQGTGSDNPICFITSGAVDVSLNTSTFDCYGQFRVGASATVNLNSATVRVYDDEGCNNNCEGRGYPGEFNIVGGTLNLGSATVTVEDRWTNNIANVANYDRGTSTVRLYWDFSNTNGTPGTAGHYFVGPTNLAEPEFYNLTVRAVGTGARTVVAINDSPPWGPVWVDNEFRLQDTDGGSLALDMQNQNVTVNGTLSVEANATLTMGTGDLLDMNRLDVDGTLSMDSVTVANIDLDLDQSSTLDVTAWTAYVLTAASFDVRWTVAGVSDSATLTVTLGELTHTVATNYSLARGGANVREERVAAADTTVTFRLGGDWGTSDAMALTASDAPPLGGGGGEPPRPFPYWALVLLLGAAFVVYSSVRSRRRRRRR